MRNPIGSAIVGAAVMAVRSLGSVQAMLVVRPPSLTTAADLRGGAQVREASLIKIEINFNR